MLATLENNQVRGGKWHSLIDKVYHLEDLYAAYRDVAVNKGAPGIDHLTIEDFTAGLIRNLAKLHDQLADDTYRPPEIKRVQIPKPGTSETRPLGIRTVGDRVAQAALRHVLKPILERQFAQHGYGFRPDRGCKDALPRVDQLVNNGYRYTVDPSDIVSGDKQAAGVEITESELALLLSGIDLSSVKRRKRYAKAPVAS